MFEDNRAYRYTFQSYAPGSAPWITSDCNEIAFWNRGTSNVIVGDVLILLPLDFVSLPGHKGEIDKTQYVYQFSGSGTNLLIVVRKTYI